MPHLRSTLPSPAKLGLYGSHAMEDLTELGWTTPECADSLWTLSAAGDPDLALNGLIRLTRALAEESPAARDQLLDVISQDSAFTIRLFALLGGSTLLSDHLIAHPELWTSLLEPLPTAEEMYQHMLRSVNAQPAEVDPPAEVLDRGADTASPSLSTPGTYRAALTGTPAEQNMQVVYRTLIMRIAAYDLAGTYSQTFGTTRLQEIPVMAVTGLLTSLADAALTAALAVAVATVYPQAPVDTRLVIMAMGKCGARELNYISDVDVVFVAEPSSAKATRLAGEFNRIASTTFFEVDAALRPEGKHGALVRTLDSHVAYYKKWAHTWEFQALLKARPMTGYVPLGEAYCEQLSPLVWEASQRESFVDDVQAMRRRVVENVPKELQNRELKLGDGGLRDVEFAVQLLQMVHGRSDERLRVSSTVTALHALVVGGYVGRDDGQALIAAYEFLRLLEHRLQLQRLRRTHVLPPQEDGEALQWLAKASGFSSDSQASATKKLSTTLREIRKTVHSLHRRLFYRPLLNSVVTKSVDELRLSPDAARLQLAALGYQYPDRAFEHLQALASAGKRKQKIQAMLLPTLLEWLADTSDPDAGLLNYRKLSDAANDRNWFLRMLRDEGVVGQRLMHVLGSSQFTADLIISAPDIVRSFGDGATGPKLVEPDSKAVAKSLITAAGRYPNAHRAIAVARALRRTELARISSCFLLNMMDTREVCEALTAIWEAVLEAALQAEIRENLATHDVAQPPARIAIIGMGRLGGRELSFRSDADVLFVCEPAEGIEESEAVRWVIGICDSLRSRLGKPSGDPPLDIDLGLRPEGRSGPIVRTVDSYATYYQRWGEPWEMQALLRAAWVAGDPEVARHFFEKIDPLRYPSGGVADSTLREIRRIKARVDNERLPHGADPRMHLKLGRGGLSDVEWTVQLLTMEHAHKCPDLKTTSTLDALDALQEYSILPSEQVDMLREAWLTATRVRNALVLVSGKAKDELPGPGSLLKQVAGAASWDPQDYQGFLDHYLRITRHARQVVDEVFWGESTMEP